jgi:multidrug transporter EmrE-like cation transporter
MIMALIPLILLTALLNTSAQLILKAGMGKIGEFSFTMNNLIPIGMKVIFSPFIMIGVVIYVMSLCLWLLVLSRVPVAIAYPMASIAYIFNAVGAYYLFGEHLSFPQIIGIFVIIFGVYLLTQH